MLENISLNTSIQKVIVSCLVDPLHSIERSKCLASFASRCSFMGFIVNSIHSRLFALHQ